MSATQTDARPRRALPQLMTMTDGAAERLRALYAKGQEGMLLRIGVKTIVTEALQDELRY